MRIGLIDVDSHNFPNLPLMKLSAWHKSQGDSAQIKKHFDTVINAMTILLSGFGEEEGKDA